MQDKKIESNSHINETNVSRVSIFVFHIKLLGPITITMTKQITHISAIYLPSLSLFNMYLSSSLSEA